MLEAFWGGLVNIFTWPAFPLMIVGIIVGFWVGILPGLGGAVTLALMIPFIYGMEPIAAFAFLLGMHSVVQTTGDITSILFGVPGEGTAAATIVDGHPMAKKGEAGRALGAALFSSLIGALIGAFALAASIPVIQPLVLALGSPELFMLTLLGISFIASLSGGSVIRGLASGFFGFLLATVGMSDQTATLRYTFGQVYLFDGLSLVPITIGLFAIPEIIDLAVRGTSIAETHFGKLVGVWEGVKDTVRHWGLTVRASLIGTFIGLIPGMGGSVAQWVAYGHAVQSSKDKSRFGQGAVEGVLGPGAANNSKEGGSLIPTVAFGVPGSLSTAILLGAFLIVDLEPGPEMLSKHLDVTFSMVWIIVVANIITVAASFVFLDHLAKITLVRGSLIIPFLLLLIFLGSFATNNDFGDIVVMLLFGLLGYLMVLFRWPRPPLILGLVLGGLSERYLFISVQRYKAEWLTFPGVIVILLLMLAALTYPLVQARYARRRAARGMVREN
ncbi:MAG: tripartite tricarboxylate transporter permease [Candidatus Binatia bacterium]